MKKLFLTIIPLALLLNAAAPVSRRNAMLDQAAEGYVKLALEVGAYSPGYIDAYYGPGEWAVTLAGDARHRGFPAAALRQKAAALLERLAAAARTELTPPEKLRVEFLRRQLVAAAAEIDVLSGRKLGFDTESRLFYDAVAPARDPAEFAATIAELEKALPGSGPLPQRLAAFRKEFYVPADRTAVVFDAAIAECRRRTLAHMKLPANESFQAAYVKDKPWGAYNWYKGNAFSLIEVNTDLPMIIDSAVPRAAHEGYPGHHVYNVLLEEKLAKGLGWIEFTVYPLFSPQSLIAEGTANYGIELLFPGREQLDFEKRVLYPLAGLDPEKAEPFARVQKLTRRLDAVGVEAARGYLDGVMNREQTLRRLESCSLEPPEQAAKTIEFFDAYRSYVINYTLGQDIVRAFVERNAGPPATPERKWQVFYEILTTPRTPSGLSELADR